MAMEKLENRGRDWLTLRGNNFAIKGFM